MTLGLRTFRSKVLALALGAALVPALLVGHVFYRGAREDMEGRSGESLALAAQFRASRVTLFLGERKSEVATLATSPALREECRRLMHLAPADDAYSRTRYRLGKYLELAARTRWVSEAWVVHPV